METCLKTVFVGSVKRTLKYRFCLRNNKKCEIRTLAGACQHRFATKRNMIFFCFCLFNRLFTAY